MAVFIESAPASVSVQAQVLIVRPRGLESIVIRRPGSGPPINRHKRPRLEKASCGRVNLPLLLHISLSTTSGPTSHVSNVSARSLLSNRRIPEISPKSTEEERTPSKAEGG